MVSFVIDKIINFKMKSIIDQIQQIQTYTFRNQCCLMQNQIANRTSAQHHSQTKNTHQPPKGILLTKRSLTAFKPIRQITAHHQTPEKQYKNNSESTKIMLSLGSKNSSRKNSQVNLLAKSGKRLDMRQKGLEGGNIKLNIMKGLDISGDRGGITMISQISRVNEQFISNGSQSIGNLNMILNLTEPAPHYNKKINIVMPYKHTNPPNRNTTHLNYLQPLANPYTKGGRQLFL